MKSLKIALAISLCGMSFANQQAANADDRIIYPASMCVKWTAADPTPRLSSSRMFNDSSSRALRVDCPMPHVDDTGIFSNDRIEDIDLGAIDVSNTSRVRCTSVGVHQVGVNLIQNTFGTRQTVGFGNAEQNLDFPAANGNGATWHYLSCIVPRRTANGSSGLTYYKVNQ